MMKWKRRLYKRRLWNEPERIIRGITVSYESAKKRCDNATEGPWIEGIDCGSVVNPNLTVEKNKGERDDEVTFHYGGKPIGESIERPDRDFIAHARQDLPAALELINALLQLSVNLQSEPTLTQINITTMWRRFQELP